MRSELAMPASARPERSPGRDEVIAFENVALAFDDQVILESVSFVLERGRTKVILGGSGAGKSTVLKLILGLWKPDSGVIRVNGRRIDRMGELDLMEVRAHLGMVFQEGALFDSLTVRENVGYKLYEETDLPLDQVHRRVREVLGFVDLSEHIDKMPSELSGGQRRRVAIARAMAAKPEVLLYDEPTTGLDPITARAISDEIIKLRDLEEVTTMVVTHQLRDAFYIATHAARRDHDRILIEPATPEKCDEAEFIMIRDGGVAFEGTADALRQSTDEYLRTFLS